MNNKIKIIMYKTCGQCKKEFPSSLDFVEYELCPACVKASNDRTTRLTDPYLNAEYLRNEKNKRLLIEALVASSVIFGFLIVWFMMGR